MESVAHNKYTMFVPCVALLILAGCGGGGSSDSDPSYTIAGTVSGLITGRSLVLQDNGGDNLTVSADGTLAFHTPIANGGNYDVTVLTQPAGESCVVASGAGTVSGSNVNVAVTCTPTYSIGVNVVGLLPNSNLVLQDNGADSLSVTTGGTYSFSEQLATGSPYDVTVSGQPTGQTCTVSSGSGTVGTADVVVTVTCPWHVLYAGSYGFSGGGSVYTGIVAGFAIDPSSGAIAALPAGFVTVGNGLEVGLGLTADSSGKHLYVSSTWGPNTNSQTEDDVSVFSIASATAALQIQGSPLDIAPVNFDKGSLLINPSGTLAYAQPEGIILAIDPGTGALTLSGNAAGWGTIDSPQGNPYGACALAPGGAFAYCTSAPSQSSGAASGSGLVTQFAIDPSTGVATEGASVAAGDYPANIAITPNGEFAYVADGTSLWAYAIDANTGALTPLGSSPTTTPEPIQAIAMTPNGAGVYMVVTGALIGYSIDAATGALTQVSGTIAIAGSMAPPPPIQIDPSGRFIYVPAVGNEMYAAAIDPSSGALTAVAGSPFSTAITGVTSDSLDAVATAIAAVIP